MTFPVVMVLSQRSLYWRLMAAEIFRGIRMLRKKTKFLFPLRIFLGAAFLPFHAFSGTPPHDCASIAASPKKGVDKSLLTAVLQNGEGSNGIQVAGKPTLFWLPSEGAVQSVVFCARISLQVSAPSAVTFLEKVYKPKSDGKLELMTEWTENPRSLVLSQVDMNGKVRTTTVTVNGPSLPGLFAKFLPKKKPLQKPQAKWTANFGVQPGYLVYQQTRLSTPYRAGVLTLKAGGNWMLDDRDLYALDLGGYFTLGHLAQSTNDSPRFFGMNVRFTRKLGQWEGGPGSPIFRLGVGPYYLTTFIPTKSFGFINLAGLQLLPTARFQLHKWGFLGRYVKFSTVNKGISFKGFSNRELAFGFNWSPMRGWMIPWSLSFDYADLSTQIQEEVVQLNTVNFGVAYRFK